MSRHYLLDGYNIIKQTPSLNLGTLEAQRQALIQWIVANQPQGRTPNSVTIVFDGNQEFFGSHSSSSVRVVFASGRGQSADDLIKKIAEQSSSKKNLIVVSNDKDITLYVRALGGNVLSVKEFIRIPGAKFKHAAKNQAEASKKNIPLAQQTKINQELERIWINPTRDPRQEGKRKV